MTPAALAKLFRTERRRFDVDAGLGIDTEGRPPSARSMGYTDGKIVWLYARLLDQPKSRVVAVIRHELAHVYLFARPHTELEADRLAEAVGGQRIRYDRKGIQTLGPGRWPRPPELPR